MSHNYLSSDSLNKRLKTIYLFLSLVFILQWVATRTFAQGPSNSISLKDPELRFFVTPPAESKPWAFFWWFNGYVDSASITNHLTALKNKGIGGVVLYASNAPDIPKESVFMSPEWRTLFRFAVKESDRLGLEMGVNICNGWPFGGPWITPANNTWTTISSSKVVEGGKKIKVTLPRPAGENQLYHDIAIQAIPYIASSSNTIIPVISASSNQEGTKNLQDGNYFTQWSGQSTSDEPISANNPQWLTFKYSEEKEVDCIWLGSIAFGAPKRTDIQYSKDGLNFHTIKEINTSNYLSQSYESIPKTTARFFRLVFKAGSAWPTHVDLGEVALGLKPEVYRIMQRAFKEGKNGPEGITSKSVLQQLNFVNGPLQVLSSIKPIKTSNVIDISKFCDSAGNLDWDAPPGKWKIIRLGETNTAVGSGGGLLGDYMSKRAADQHFNKFLKILIADAGPLAGKTLKYFHEDNVEIHGPFNWTPSFLKEFKSRRGYDPQPYLSILSGETIGDQNITNRFLEDYRRTIGDLVTANHYGYLADLAKASGLGMQAEAGGPYLPFMLNNDALANLGKMTIPVAEFWESKQWKENQQQFEQPAGIAFKRWAEDAQNINAKEAATAGHIYGKKIIAAEAFTSLGPNSHWGVGPADLLLYANIAFCEGINRFILHSSTTTKASDGLPGYEYGAGTHLNQNVTWWKDSAPFFKFLGRCEYMLQSGNFVADVLYYNGDNVPNIVTPKHVPSDLGKGYDYDVCNTEVLQRLSVKNGRLTLPDGMSYRMLVLPKNGAIKPDVLKKLKHLVASGATVVGSEPTRAIGLKGYPASDKLVSMLAGQIWGNADGQKIFRNNLGKGRVFNGLSARQILKLDKVGPDFAFTSNYDQAAIDFIHRRTANMDIYFIANRRDTTTKAMLTFRISGRQPELWDPFSGAKRPAVAFHQNGTSTSLPITLNPYGSCFVIFKKQIPLSKNGSMKSNTPKVIFDQNIGGPFDVTFYSPTGGSFESKLRDLEDWAQSPKPEIRYFSGTGVYTKDFKFPETSDKSHNKKIILDLGTLKNTAHVYVNGKDLGVLWAPPYQVDITDVVKPGNNHLSIDVTNTWFNRLTGDARLPVADRKTHTNIIFSPNNTLRQSGLLGPIRIGYIRTD